MYTRRKPLDENAKPKSAGWIKTWEGRLQRDMRDFWSEYYQEVRRLQKKKMANKMYRMLGATPEQKARFVGRAELWDELKRR